jgi:hypothetical protein
MTLAVWAVLVGLNILVLALMLAGGSFTAYARGLWVFVIAQVVILLTPAVRHRVRQGQ